MYISHADFVGPDLLDMLLLLIVLLLKPQQNLQIKQPVHAQSACACHARTGGQRRQCSGIAHAVGVVVHSCVGGVCIGVSYSSLCV